MLVLKQIVDIKLQLEPIVLTIKSTVTESQRKESFMVNQVYMLNEITVDGEASSTRQIEAGLHVRT